MDIFFYYYLLQEIVLNVTQRLEKTFFFCRGETSRPFFEPEYT